MALRRALGLLVRLLAGLLLLALLALFALLVPAAWVFWQTRGARYANVNAVPVSDAALVFGAGLQADGTPTPLLADRIHAAVLLYRAGRVPLLLLSGDGSSPEHNEPLAMARQVEAEGVPPQAILTDPAGLHTQTSCDRARHVYHLTSVVAVSQSYHLPRAIFACRTAGLRTVGFSLSRVPYAGSPAIRGRELLSLDLNWWDAVRREL